jgi:hypothetical protein
VSANGDPTEYQEMAKSGTPLKMIVADGHEFVAQLSCETIAVTLAGGKSFGSAAYLSSNAVTQAKLLSDGLDTTPRIVTANNNSKRKANTRAGYSYFHTAIDDYSRLAYTEALENEKGVTAAQFWLRAVAFFAEHGIVHVKRCLTDNGSCYRSRAWASAFDTTATTHKRTRPYTPKTNGKVERFNGTLAREWAYVKPYDSEEARTAELVPFLNYYNHERPHASLKHQPPCFGCLFDQFSWPVG